MIKDATRNMEVCMTCMCGAWYPTGNSRFFRAGIENFQQDRLLGFLMWEIVPSVMRIEF